MFKNLKKVLVAGLVLTAMVAPSYTSSANDSTGLTKEGHTKEELDAYWKGYKSQAKDKWDYYGIDLIAPNSKEVYAKAYTDDGKEAGKLSSATLNDSLHVINTMRYMAGLDEVSLDSSKNEKAQAASYVNYLNNSISHNPNKPSQMKSSKLYELGKTGAGESNLHYGSQGFFAQVVSQMRDSTGDNPKHLGHRRWLLDPNAKTMGVGGVGAYGAVHVIGSYSANTEVIAWPSYATYSQVFGEGTAWSVLIGKDSGIKINSAKVQVEDLSNNKEETYTKGQGLKVNTEGFGWSDALIFGANLDTSPGKNYQVKVQGLTKNGKSYPIIYNVNFVSTGQSTSENEEPAEKPDDTEENSQTTIEKIKAALESNKKKLGALEVVKKYMPESYKRYKSVIDEATKSAEKSIAAAEAWLAKNGK